jgi:hypothetical protein
MSRVFVCHDEGADVGLRSPEFSSIAEAEAARDKWNVETPGHFVLEIDCDEAEDEQKCKTVNSESVPDRGTKTSTAI